MAEVKQQEGEGGAPETGVQFTWPKYLSENLPENLPEKTSHQKVTIKKSNWTFGKILGKILVKIFWPCELNPWLQTARLPPIFTTYIRSRPSAKFCTCKIALQFLTHSRIAIQILLLSVGRGKFY